MKQLTCKEIGGVCDMPISASSKKEFLDKAHKHVEDSHDKQHKELLARMKKASKAEMDKWGKKFDKQWKKAPAA